MQASAEFATDRVRRGRGALAPWVVVSLVAHVLALGLLASAVDLTSLGRSLGELVYRALGPLQIRLVPPQRVQEAPADVAAWEAAPVAVPAPRDTRSPGPQETVKASKQAPRPAVRQRPKPPGSVGSRAPREPERDIVKRAPPAPARAPGDTAVERPVAQTQSTGPPTERAADASEILRLLHQEIDRHKRYPPLARRQGRQGTSTVAFSLRPDGGVEAVALARSSGFRALDRAALRAVQGVAPFPPARDYLTEPRGFRIDVVFRLY